MIIIHSAKLLINILESTSKFNQQSIKSVQFYAPSSKINSQKKVIWFKSKQPYYTLTTIDRHLTSMELLCPAGNLPALKVAVDNGADAVYIGFKDDTNARHFAGLNFSEKKLVEAVKYVHDHNCKLHVAINTFAHPNGFNRWLSAVDMAAQIGVDALILADLAILEYAANKYPHIERHVSVQASVTNIAAIQFYHRNFAVQRIVLPRVLSLHQVKQLAKTSPVALEVFAFGSLCIMAEGRCYLSSYLTGESPNTMGACSTARFVRWHQTDQGMESRLNNILINCYSNNENASYPTLCKGRYCLNGKKYHVLEEPTSLNTLELLPVLMLADIAAVKIEGRQRSPTYVGDVTHIWRQAIDYCINDPKKFITNQNWSNVLENLSEGKQTTLGAYHRKWQ